MGGSLKRCTLAIANQHSQSGLPSYLLMLVSPTDVYMELQASLPIHIAVGRDFYSKKSLTKKMIRGIMDSKIPKRIWTNVFMRRTFGMRDGRKYEKV